jgi:transitional endoplasmic reticulum ATPase
LLTAGKTLLAKVAVTKSEANFTAVKSSELLSKWIGESEIRYLLPSPH